MVRARVWLPILAACALVLVIVLAARAERSSWSSAPEHQMPSTATTAPPVGVSDADFEPLRSGERAQVVGMSGGAYQPTPPRGGTDDYRCLLIDPQLSEDAFLTGVTFLPGVGKQVHHSILYRVRPDQVASAQSKDAAEPGQGWTCFGGPGIGRTVDQLRTSTWLAAWAPGGDEQVYPEGFGVHLPAGTQIVLQMHYNTRAGTAPDSTQVRLRLAPGSADLQRLETKLLFAPVELPCTDEETGPLCERDASIDDLAARVGGGGPMQANGLHFLCSRGRSVTPGPTQHCDSVVQERMTVYATAGHMHLLGRSISIDLNRGSATARRLLDIGAYDFDNQGAVPLDKSVTLVPGDRLRVTCTHDASLRAKLPALKDVEPRWVTWGEGTTDEMCLGLMTVVRG